MGHSVWPSPGKTKAWPEIGRGGIAESTSCAVPALLARDIHAASNRGSKQRA